MEINLEEARELYKLGGSAREIALRAFSKGEILNDYTLITTLPISLPDNCSDLYSKLSVVYKSMSKGREVRLTHGHYYTPEIILATLSSTPNHGLYVGKVIIDEQLTYRIYTDTIKTIWEGKLGFENDGVYCGHGVLNNHWIFKEKEQAEHFVKYFYKELITLELEDFHTVKFE